ncbi:MAG: AAA family ATPase [Aquificaceae bacterium]|nr:AAA family ATPase [Aquificaceae bacterium]
MAKKKRHDDYPMAFTPKELEEFIEDFIEIARGEIEEKGNGTALFILGDRGVGKSTLVRRAAEKLGYRVVVEFAGHSESATEFVGLTAIDRGEDGRLVTTRTIGKLLKRIEEELEDSSARGVVLFLDEVNHAPPSVQKALMALILDRKLGDYQLPKNVVIIAAGNFYDESPSVVEFMGVPLQSRMAKVIVKSTAEDYLNYAKTVRIHPAVLAFVKQNPDKYNKNFDVMDLTYDTSPRTLEKLSDALFSMEGNRRKVTAKKISAYVGPEVAGPIYVYYSTLHASPIMKQLDAVLGKRLGDIIYPEEFYMEVKTYTENLMKKPGNGNNGNEKAAPFVVPFMLAQTFYNQIIPTAGDDLGKGHVEKKVGIFLRGIKAALALLEGLTHATKDNGVIAQSIMESFKASITGISVNISTVMRSSKVLMENSDLVDAVRFGMALGKVAFEQNFSQLPRELDKDLDSTVEVAKKHFKETCLMAALVYVANAQKAKDPALAQYYSKVFDESRNVVGRVANYIEHVKGSKLSKLAL